MIRTSLGTMRADRALAEFQKRLPVSNTVATISFLGRVFKRLSRDLKWQAIGSLLADENAQPWRYYQGPLGQLLEKALVELGQIVTRSNHPVLIGAKRDPYVSIADSSPQESVLLKIKNTGSHLWAAADVTERKTFLSFREYCGCGKWLGSVQIQHLGHLYGVNGGPAKVIVRASGLVWNIELQPQFTYFFVSYMGSQYLFRV